jgi:hypothetical protein
MVLAPGVPDMPSEQLPAPLVRHGIPHEATRPRLSAVGIVVQLEHDVGEQEVAFQRGDELPTFERCKRPPRCDHIIAVHVTHPRLRL